MTMELTSLLKDICSAVTGVSDGTATVLSGQLPQGMSIAALDGATGRLAEFVSEWEHDTHDGSTVLAIEIAEGAASGKPVCVMVPDGRCDITITAGARSHTEFIFVYTSVESVRRYAKTGSDTSLRISDIVLTKTAGRTRIGSWTKLAERTSVDVTTVELSDNDVTVDYGYDFGQRGGELRHSALSIIGDNRKKTLNINVRHEVPECRSDVVMKGVAEGEGFGTFNGLVYVAPDAQHTEAYQQSRNMLLGDKARIITSPQLEIYADDVKCSHGAAVGQMNDDAVYYMRQRGLSEAEARGLQLSGFVNEIVSRLEVPELVEALSELAQQKISGLHTAI